MSAVFQTWLKEISILRVYHDLLWLIQLPNQKCKATWILDKHSHFKLYHNHHLKEYNDKPKKSSDIAFDDFCKLLAHPNPGCNAVLPSSLTLPPPLLTPLPTLLPPLLKSSGGKCNILICTFLLSLFIPYQLAGERLIVVESKKWSDSRNNEFFSRKNDTIRETQFQM